jgi:hypothetical protein
MDTVNFYCDKKKSKITVPISDCYKIRNRKKTEEGCNYEFAVKTITPEGNCIKKSTSRDDFEMLRCRMVQY